MSSSKDSIQYHGFPAHLRPEQTVRVITPEDYLSVHQRRPVHRHSFYELLFVWRGAGHQSIDFNRYAIGNNSIFFIQPNQVHQADRAQLDIFDVIIFNDEFYRNTTTTLGAHLQFPFSNLRLRLSDAETVQFQKYLTLFKEEYFGNADTLILRNLLEVVVRLLADPILLPPRLIQKTLVLISFRRYSNDTLGKSTLPVFTRNRSVLPSST